MKTQESAPTYPPIIQPSTPPILGTIILIKKFTKHKKIPHIIKTRKTQTAPQQVQHRLRRSPRNFGTNFRTQEAHHLVPNHFFKSLHDFHIYNKQDKKVAIDNLLMGGDSDTWWKAIGNELGRLANGIDNRVRANNTIQFIKKEEVPKGHTVKYTIFL